MRRWQRKVLEPNKIIYKWSIGKRTYLSDQIMKEEHILFINPSTALTRIMKNKPKNRFIT